MKEKIVAALKTKYSNLGFGAKAFEGVADYLAATVTEESQIETGIAGVENLLKAFQGDVDKRVNDAVAKAKAETPKPGDPKPAETPKPGEEMPAWAKTLMEKVEGFEKGKSKETLGQKAAAALKAKNIPEAFSKISLKNLSIDKEDDLDAWVNEIEESFTDFQKTSNQSRFDNAVNPLESAASPDSIKQDIKNWAAGKDQSNPKS